MGRYFDTAATLATFATKRPVLSQKSQLSQPARSGNNETGNIVDLRHAFEERAAIMEFDGNLSRGEAERRAAEDTGYCPDER